MNFRNITDASDVMKLREICRLLMQKTGVNRILKNVITFPSHEERDYGELGSCQLIS